MNNSFNLYKESKVFFLTIYKQINIIKKKKRKPITVFRYNEENKNNTVNSNSTKIIFLAETERINPNITSNKMHLKNNNINIKYIVISKLLKIYTVIYERIKLRMSINKLTIIMIFSFLNTFRKV